MHRIITKKYRQKVFHFLEIWQVVLRLPTLSIYSTTPVPSFLKFLLLANVLLLAYATADVGLGNHSLDPARPNAYKLCGHYWPTTAQKLL